MGIVRDEIYLKEGFNPFWDLAKQLPFKCVGTFVKPNGVWIGNNYIVTVAHGFVDKTGNAPSVKDASFNLYANGREYKYPARRIYVPKTYIEGTLQGGAEGGDKTLRYDIAVVELRQNVRVSGVEPAEIYDNDKEIGRTAVFVGFGDRGTSNEGTNLEKFGSGQGFLNDVYADKPPRAMAFMNMVDREFANGWCLASKYDSKKKISLLGITASGDSGGGTFAEIDGGWKLIGINHNGIPRPGSNQPTWAKGNTEGSSTLTVKVSRFAKAIKKGIQMGNWAEFCQM